MLIPPYGGHLVDLMVSPEEQDQVKEEASSLPSVLLSNRALCDLEILATGGFSPLDRFMGKDDFSRVLKDMRLSRGDVFPIPVTLPVEADDNLEVGVRVALRTSSFDLIGVMSIEEKYMWDRDEMAVEVLGTTDPRHPLVAEMRRWGEFNISGPLSVLRLPRHTDFEGLCLTPAETRRRLELFDNTNVVAFNTRNPMHRVHEELTKRAAERMSGVLLVHPVVGMTKPGDIDPGTRVLAYKALIDHYYEGRQVLLSVLPLAMRMAGPREALWHAIIRRNYGANHLIVGRDHAGPGGDSTGKPFYGPYDAQKLVTYFKEEIGVSPIPFSELVYLTDEDRYEEASIVAKDTPKKVVSGTLVRDKYLAKGRLIPSWLSRPEVASVLVQTVRPRSGQGACIWFTGLSGSGKSATAELLDIAIKRRGREVTVLDGDVVRSRIHRGLGFSKRERDLNIRTIGFIASEIVRHGGLVVCSAVSPYRDTRDEVRDMIGTERFVEVYVDTPVNVCQERDPKGLYSKARKGEIKNLTGISDPYEPPEQPEITLDTVNQSVEQNVQLVLNYLIRESFVGECADGDTPV